MQFDSTEGSALAPYQSNTKAESMHALHGLKNPGIFNENKRFLGKVIFIPQQLPSRAIHLV